MGASYGVQELSAAGACFAEASRLLYCEPDNDEVVQQACEHVFASAPFGMDNERVRRGLNGMDTWLETLDASDEPSFAERVDELRREWLRLFIGAGTPDAPCWESFYREPNSHLFGACTLEVRACYKRHGLQIERLRSEPDDHLGLMLGFVSFLISAEIDSLQAGDEEAATGLASEQDGFLTEHVLPWLAAWHYEVDQHASSDYFRGAGSFVLGLCERYAQRFGIGFDEEKQVFKRTHS